MTMNEAKTKVLNVARAEIGTREGLNNYNKYAGELDNINGLFTCNMQNQPWCAILVLYCFYKAFGIDNALRTLCSPMPTGIPLCETSARYFKTSGRFYTSDPDVGDVIYFNVNGGINHMGIIESVSGSEITAIEGNTSDMVARRVYNISNGYIAGYGRPRYELVSSGDVNKITVSETNKSAVSRSFSPIVCMMTHSSCYQGTRPMTVRGVLWHSTGANNPWLKRYVQPDDLASNKGDLLQKLGINYNQNDWNHVSVQAGVNAWIGKLNDGTVASVQVMPWNYKPWGCGSGSKGSCNDGWIQFEICEDGLEDPSYFNAVYQEGVRLTAYLCRMHGINPIGLYNGIPTILCHQDSYKFGMGSNHADVYHWFNRFGKTMDGVRHDVAAILNGSSSAPQQNQTQRDLGAGDFGSDVKDLQERLIKIGYSLPKYGADGDFGSETDAAVRLLQQRNGLRVDGIVGSDTRAVINKLLKSGSSNNTPGWVPAVGDIVNYRGNVHYFSANTAKPTECKGGKAKITQIYRVGSSKHPYHLVSVAGGGSTVRGWVDEGTFEKA